MDWFSKGWWCVIKSEEDSAKVVDLRFTEIPDPRGGSHEYWNWPFAWKFHLDPQKEIALKAVVPDVQEPMQILRLLGQRIRGGDGWLVPQTVISSFDQH